MVVKEKEVVKPLPLRKILAIVAPIVLVIVIASALMGVYIPRAIKANTPPIDDNTPDISTNPPAPIVPKYQEVMMVSAGRDVSSDFIEKWSYSTNLYDNENKIAYYTFKPQFNSDYYIDITAPKDSKVVIDEQEFATFEETGNMTYSSYMEKGSEHKFYVDETNCDINDIGTDEHKIRIRQKVGYNDITVRANSEYAFALSREELSYVKRLLINNPEIKFISVQVNDRYENMVYYDENGEPYVIPISVWQISSDVNKPLYDLGEGVSQIDVLIKRETSNFNNNGDFECILKTQRAEISN